MALSALSRPPARTGQGTRSLTPSAAADASLLWSPAALARWGFVVGASIISAVVCYYVMSGDGTWNDEVPAMDVAIFSVVVASAAHISLLQAGRRAVGLRRRALLGEPAAEAVAAETIPAALFTDAETLVAAPGLKHFHLSECPLAAGRGWSAESRLEHLSAGRTPCGVCRP